MSSCQKGIQRLEKVAKISRLKSQKCTKGISYASNTQNNNFPTFFKDSRVEECLCNAVPQNMDTEHLKCNRGLQAACAPCMFAERELRHWCTVRQACFPLLCKITSHLRNS